MKPLLRGFFIMSKKTAVTFYNRKSIIEKVKKEAQERDTTASGLLKELLAQAKADNFVPLESQLDVITSKITLNLTQEQKKELTDYLDSVGIKNFNNYATHVIEKYL
jgi:hypothetical protein